MGILDSLQNALNQGSGGFGHNTAQRPGQTSQSQNGIGSGLQNVYDQLFGNPSTGLGTPILGGLVGAFMGGRSPLKGAATGALVMKGIQMFDQYRQRMKQEAERNPNTVVAQKFTQENVTPSSTDERARRIIRAVVYAARSDGTITPAEEQAIQERVKMLNIGPEGEQLVEQATREPLDPQKIAEGIQTPDEALEVFTVSCAVLQTKGFMESAYLNQLAQVLAIPNDVRDDLVAKIDEAAQA